MEIFARSTKKIKEGILGRFMSFGKNVLLGNDTKMQGLLEKLEKLTKSEGRLVGAETLVETKNTGKGVQAIQESMTAQTAVMTQQTTAMAALQVSAHEVCILRLIEFRHSLSVIAICGYRADAKHDGGDEKRRQRGQGSQARGSPQDTAQALCCTARPNR